MVSEKDYGKVARIKKYASFFRAMGGGGFVGCFMIDQYVSAGIMAGFYVLGDLVEKNATNTQIKYLNQRLEDKL